MSFASEPGRDDGNLPPVNIVVPDDARDLDRDVLAYRREMRVKRRRQRLLRLFRPLRLAGFGRPTAFIPLLAVCLAVCLVGGAVLSVATMSPASAPTLSESQPSRPATPARQLTALPPGDVLLDQGARPVRMLVTSAIALVPAGCDCGTELQRLAGQASAAHVRLFFVGTSQPIAQLDDLVHRYGAGLAAAAADRDQVLTMAYHPVDLTVLLVYADANADVRRNLPVNFDLSTTLHELAKPSSLSVG